MAETLEKIDYTLVPGTKTSHKLRLYSLSTCGFCKRAMSYLEQNGYEFAYVHLDQLDYEVKRAAKQELKATYHNVPVFPILTIDDKEAVSGFIEDKWAKMLAAE